MTREETAEWVGHYFGLQRAGNIKLPGGDADTINRFRMMLDAAMAEVKAKLPLGTIDAWPRVP